MRGRYCWASLMELATPTPSHAIQLARADAAEFLEHEPAATFAGFTLSNILDGANDGYRRRLFAAVKRTATPDAIVVMRSFREPAVAFAENRATADRSMIWGIVDVRPAVALGLISDKRLLRSWHPLARDQVPGSIAGLLPVRRRPLIVRTLLDPSTIHPDPLIPVSRPVSGLPRISRARLRHVDHPRWRRLDRADDRRGHEGGFEQAETTAARKTSAAQHARCDEERDSSSTNCRHGVAAFPRRYAINGSFTSLTTSGSMWGNSASITPGIICGICAAM